MFSNALWMFIVNVSSRYLENVIAWNDTEWPKIDPVTLDKTSGILPVNSRPNILYDAYNMFISILVHRFD